MALYRFPDGAGTGDEVAGRRQEEHRGEGARGDADFQMSQKQIEKTLPDYSVVVNPAYAAEAAK